MMLGAQPAVGRPAYQEEAAQYTIEDGVVTSCDLEGSVPRWSELDEAADQIVALNISNGTLTDLSNVCYFTHLQSLVADDNMITSLDSFPAIPCLRTLSLNKNRISSLATFLDNATAKFPALIYLSLLGNPCCPSEIFGSQRQEYKQYVDDVLEAIPKLKYLDSTEVVRHSKGVEDLYGSNVAYQVNSEMLFAKFEQIVAKHVAAEKAAQDDETEPETGRRPPLNYLQVKAKLVEEFGSVAFDLKKEQIRRRMQRLDEELNSTQPPEALKQTEPPHWLEPLPVGPEIHDESIDRFATSGSVLQVTVTRSKRYELGFNFDGGVNHWFRGVFITRVSDSIGSAELKEGDRVLAVDKWSVLSTTVKQTTQLMRQLPQQSVFTVHRIGPVAWAELQELVSQQRGSVFDENCRSIDDLPLLRHTSFLYLGPKELLLSGASNHSGGKVGRFSIKRRGPREPIGLKLAGAFELGGIFIADIKEDSPASRVENLQIGFRILSVSGISVIFSSQEEVSSILRRSPTIVDIVCQEVDRKDWIEICKNSSEDISSNNVAKALLARKEKRIPDAVKSYENALKDEFIEPLTKCQALGGLGSIYTTLEKYVQAIDLHTEEVEIGERVGNRYIQARALDNLGLAYRENGQLQFAVETYKKELHVVKVAPRDLAGSVRSCSNLGVTYGTLKEYSEAVKFHSEALHWATSSQDMAAVARAHSNLGISYSMQNEFDQSIKHHRERLKIAEGLNDKAGQFRALGNLCAAAKAKGDMEDAREYLRRQQELRPESKRNQ